MSGIIHVRIWVYDLIFKSTGANRVCNVFVLDSTLQPTVWFGTSMGSVACVLLRPSYTPSGGFFGTSPDGLAGIISNDLRILYDEIDIINYPIDRWYKKERKGHIRE